MFDDSYILYFLFFFSLSLQNVDHCLDAEFVDVYKGTNGVIMVYDITKQW